MFAGSTRGSIFQRAFRFYSLLFGDITLIIAMMAILSAILFRTEIEEVIYTKFGQRNLYYIILSFLVFISFLQVTKIFNFVFIRQFDERRLDFELESASAEERLTSRLERLVDHKIDQTYKRLSNIQQDDIKDKIKEQIRSEIGAETINYIGSELSKRTSSYYEKSEVENVLNSFINESISFARAHASASARRAAFYTILSFIFSIAGVISLLYNFYYLNFLDTRTHDALAGYDYYKVILIRSAPAIAITLLCEFLALIMLKSHTRSMEYLRYFLNETVNLGARRLAITAAFKTNNGPMIKKSLEMLLSLERNTVLSSNQKTLELLTLEIENSFYKDIIPKISPFANSNKEKTDSENRSKKDKI